MVPRVVVFKDSASEIARLGTLFYGDQESQRRALALCKAYEVRAPLPASIHLTALIVSAIHNDVPQNDMFAIRQTYAMALIRFVNEILDAAQQGRSAVPLHSLARDMDLPNSFVELRHAATHEDLPSVLLLREMAHRATDWLRVKYWVLNEITPVSNGLMDPNVDKEYPQTRIKNVLREWRRARRSNPGDPDLTQEQYQVVQELKREMLVEKEAFFDVLFNRNILVPAGSGEVSKRGCSAVLLWGPLFCQLGNDLLISLAEKLAAALNKRDWPDVGLEERQYPVYMTWLEYLIPLVRRPIAALSELPRPWNAILLNLYGRNHNDKASIRLADDMAVVTGTKLPKVEIKKPENLINASTTDNPSPWSRISGWTPRPIGT